MVAKFITFEGVEGSGKSTQIRLLEKTLQKMGHETIVTREPGGSKIGDQIREILLNKENKEMLSMTELLLYVAGRAQHVYQVIQPALKEGKIVLSDRFADSSAAYQGAARAIDEATLKKIHELAIKNFQPDLTFLLDLPAQQGLKRIRGARGRLDRLEEEALAFHEKVRLGYLALAKKEPKRFCVLNAGDEEAVLHEKILKETLKILR